MPELPTITEDELIRQIKTKLGSRQHTSSYSDMGVAPAATEPAVYVLILGAGFSQGVVPLVQELMYLRSYRRKFGATRCNDTGTGVVSYGIAEGPGPGLRPCEIPGSDGR